MIYRHIEDIPYPFLHDDYKPECSRDFDYLKGDTLIYTKENIDYRTL